MANTTARETVKTQLPKRKRDLPSLIKWILLILLVILIVAQLYSGEFIRIRELNVLSWIIFLLKLLLIAVLIWLMCVQRDLKCGITQPASGDCVAEQTDTSGGFQFIEVKGTASGGAFGHYTLSISGPHPYTVTYPAGGGATPVVGGLLGTIDTTALDHGSYTITLTVYPAWSGTPKICTVTFTLLKVAVYITSIAGVNAVPNCFDETSELVVGAHIISVGGALQLTGSAYIYECTGRKVSRYELRYTRISSPGPGPSQPATDTPIPADWPASQLLHSPLVYDPSKYWPWTEVGEMPTNLINDWGTIHVGLPSPGGTDYPVLAQTSWDSRGTTGNPGGGRYYLLLITEDTAGHRYYDLQRVWLDNWPVLCQIVKFQKPGATAGTWVDLPPCTDILISWQKLRIIGLAWDALIDATWAATAPNDNFDSYGLSYLKQFAPAAASIPITAAAGHPLLSPTRRVPDSLAFAVPPGPTAADADLLVEWDLTTLDAGNSPTGKCNAALPVGHENELYRGCSCTYTLSLGVSDKTVTETVGDYSLHHPSTSMPIKIVNDL